VGLRPDNSTWRVSLTTLAALVVAFILVPAAAAAAPDTKITAGPSGPVASRTATFRFKASLAGSTFQCKLDGASWSACTSPKTYKNLKQGEHAFRVRARKNGVFDKSPAVRQFEVDTIKPETTLLSWPNVITQDHSPSFTFESNEPGTFECKLAGPSFAPCTSPYVPASPLVDGVYTFRVRARDAAGNLDATPATNEFDTETLLKDDLATFEALAEQYFPDSLDLDVPVSCPTVECPGGVPAAAGNQLHVESSRSGELINVCCGLHRYDLTVTATVTTLNAFLLTYAGANCTVTLNSANGSSPTWTFTTQLDYVFDASVFGERRISPGNQQVTGIESADYSLSGDLICYIAGALIPASVIQDNIEQWFANVSVCTAKGPDYYGPCTPP
jgi:hypothetical protein